MGKVSRNEVVVLLSFKKFQLKNSKVLLIFFQYISIGFNSLAFLLFE